MEFINEELEKYAQMHSSNESAILKKINRDTYANVLMPRMLSGHLQGRFLSMISAMIRPKNILEIGTFTGYSAICLAEGLAEDGQLYTIDINEELEDRVRGYFEEAGLSKKINYFIGNASELIPKLELSFDLVFIDADKINYAMYYNQVFDKVRKGGFIIADNVLWSGKVLGAEGKKADKDTQALMDFNDMVYNDTRVEKTLLPLRDGLTIIKKI